MNFSERRKKQETAGCQFGKKAGIGQHILPESIGVGGFICMIGSANHTIVIDY